MRYNKPSTEWTILIRERHNLYVCICVVIPARPARPANRNNISGSSSHWQTRSNNTNLERWLDKIFIIWNILAVQDFGVKQQNAIFGFLHSTIMHTNTHMHVTCEVQVGKSRMREGEVYCIIRNQYPHRIFYYRLCDCLGGSTTVMPPMPSMPLLVMVAEVAQHRFNNTEIVYGSRGILRIGQKL